LGAECPIEKHCESFLRYTQHRDHSILSNGTSCYAAFHLILCPLAASAAAAVVAVVVTTTATRQVAMYLETHRNIGSKRAFPTGYLTGDRTVYLFTDVQAVYFLHSTIPSVTCLRLSDASVICCFTYF